MKSDVLLAAADTHKEPSFVLSIPRRGGLSGAETAWVNAALTTLFEASGQDLVGRPPSAFLDDQLLDFIGEFLAGAGKAPLALENALHISGADVSERSFDLEICSLSDGGACGAALYGRFLDTTEREQLRSMLDTAKAEVETVQNRFEHAVNSIPEGFAMFDRDDILVAFNSKYLELYKETAPAITIGATFESIMRYGVEHGQYPEADGCEEAWLAERLDRENRKRAPVERKLPGGRYLRIQEVENEHGDLIGLRSDVTQYYKQQQVLEQNAAELAALNEEARAASLQKERFFARMSHELRTPMNGILGMAEVLQHSDLDPQQEVYLHAISTSAASLLGIINDILDFSKAAEGKFIFAEEEFSLKDTVYEAARLLQPLAKEKSLDLWIDYPQAVPTHFIGDSVRVRQVLLNHLGNALKFTEEGHFGVRVAYDTNGDKQRLTLSFIDSGPGIPEAAVASLFSAYEQVNQASAKTVEGTGLGLAISKSLVDQMGGSIEVESKVGEGSRFTVTLDLQPCGAPSSAVEDLPANASKRDVAILGTATASNTVLAKMLEDRLCSVHWIDCDDAARAIGHQQFQTVIWDGDHEALRQNPERFNFAGQTGPCNHVLMISVPDAELVRSFKHIDFVATVLKPSRWEDFAPVLFPEVAEGGNNVVTPQFGQGEPKTKGTIESGGVLVVDDNRTNRLVASKLLETAGIQVDFACDGLEAVRTYEAQQHHTIFMDVAMPTLNGLEATRRIRQIEAERGLSACTIYALTANTSKSQIAMCFDAGVDGVIGKPVKRQDLLNALARKGVEPVPLIEQSQTSLGLGQSTEL